MQTTLKAKLISSLEKCFIDESIDTKPTLERISILHGQRLSFQLVMTDTAQTGSGRLQVGLRLAATLPLM